MLWENNATVFCNICQDVNTCLFVTFCQQKSNSKIYRFSTLNSSKLYTFTIVELFQFFCFQEFQDVEDERDQEELIHVLPIHFEVRDNYPNLSKLDFGILRSCPEDVRMRINEGLTLDEQAPTDLYPAFLAFTQGLIPGKFYNKPLKNNHGLISLKKPWVNLVKSI